MKKEKLYIALISTAFLFGGCSKDFLTKVPQGELVTEQITSGDGVEALLLGAYGIMNGNVSGTWGNYASAPSQWVFGELTSDNAHKGSDEKDQPAMNNLESLKPSAINDQLIAMWQVYYEGVNRCNATLRLLKQDQSSTKEISAQRAVEIEAESKMLRGHYYFFLWRVFKSLPYIDENTTFDEAKVKPNDTDIYDKIIEDVKFAVDKLPVTKFKGESGRMDKNIAKAYLGKLYLYQGKHALALPLFEEVIGSKDLLSMPFQNNFDIDKEDGPEAIMVSKHAINPNGSGDNANVGDMLSGLYGTSPVGCCGFYQPTIDLANVYQVDANGLPYLNGEYRTTPNTSDMQLTGKAKTDYKVDVTLRVDPRLDYTVGRRGVPYLDYGIMPGDDWIRDASFAGPFVGMKTMIKQSQFPGNVVAGENYITGLDVNIIRLADVILMAAECAVEASDLEKARKYVNMVRERANTLPRKQVGGVDVANYLVKPYPTFPDQAYARNAVRMERRLELALEGHRYFDLVRWGIAKQVLESYSAFEAKFLPYYGGLTYQPHNAYFPIPQTEIDRSGGTLKQHKEY
ncbi:RagB/SusD family nutrient uptake outer membrane protein [Sphingobacterium yanglingense]|uniref:Putative outer membrane starch-binding protein n=1 Tax=Sphingobacterium yanglingense TaxID=1437280 RepID=A0A4R6WIL9_9SPHI|nr:RagB/SusD family nutrient uptake outer membrane protein [Sphingobacterium yanglingense]TDQ80130.1 putative outer membrane starch-binding protein [Sphingobacterium yanglingense]